MRKTFFLLTLLTCLTTTAQTINDENVQKRNLKDFHGIQVGTGITLYLTSGGSEDVAVSASSIEFRDKISTKVENGVLKIMYETKTGSINKKKQSKNLKAYVSYKTLNMLDASTGAEVKIKGILNSTSLKMAATTGAIIDGEVNINNLTVEQNTGSKINLKGKTQTFSAEGSTGSKFEGDDLQALNCNVQVSTGAKITVTAEKELQVNASTGGVVKYKGNASIKQIKANTGGSVTKI